jgi:hypothetical protein
MRKLQLGNVPDPNREERIAAAAERTAAKAKILEEKRQDALHTLYMHARNFITTEAQLDEAIEKIFVEQPWENIPGKETSKSIWDAEGPPPSVQTMMNEMNRVQKSVILKNKAPIIITGKRMLKIAEELTGGKMA